MCAGSCWVGCSAQHGMCHSHARNCMCSFAGSAWIVCALLNALRRHKCVPPHPKLHQAQRLTCQVPSLRTSWSYTYRSRVSICPGPNSLVPLLGDHLHCLAVPQLPFMTFPLTALPSSPSSYPCSSSLTQHRGLPVPPVTAGCGVERAKVWGVWGRGREGGDNTWALSYLAFKLPSVTPSV